MKIAKDYSNVPTIYYKSEMTKCLECESRLGGGYSPFPETYFCFTISNGWSFSHGSPGTDGASEL